MQMLVLYDFFFQNFLCAHLCPLTELIYFLTSVAAIVGSRLLCRLDAFIGPFDDLNHSFSRTIQQSLNLLLNLRVSIVYMI